MSSGVTAELVELAARTSFDSLPAAIVRQIQGRLLLYLGLVIGALDEPAVASAIAAARELGGSAQATILGTGLRSSAPQAALVNGIASQVLPLQAAAAPTGPVLSAALAVGEWREVSGRDLISAVAIGCEVQCRLGLAIHPEPFEAGWGLVGAHGSVGAAIASGRLLNLRPTQWPAALRLATAEADGHRDRPGFLAKAFQVGQAGANGVLAAILAGKDFDASGQMREESQEFPTAYLRGQYPERLIDALGQRWDSAAEDAGSAAGEIQADQALRAKVHELVWPYLPRWKEQRLIELVDSLPEIEDVGAITELLEPVEDGEA